MNFRTEILRATREAASLVAKHQLGARSSIDVVSVASDFGIPVMFRPLKGLWGAFVVIDDSPGILVTTSLDLAVQRFTLAHELGHFVLNHGTQLDTEATITFEGRHASAAVPVAERAADTFASELLAPRSLMLAASQRHHWTKKALANPANIYQLALRLGVSFQAACWGLVSQKVLSSHTARLLSTFKVKEIKHALAPKALLPHPWANIWCLSQADEGSILEGAPDDLFAVTLRDEPSSGYLWELLESEGTGRVVDERTEIPDAVGGTNRRVVFVRFDAPGRHRLAFVHRRPWSQETLAHIDLQITNYGKELDGFSRAKRAQLLEIA